MNIFSWFKSRQRMANGRNYIGIVNHITNEIVCYCESIYDAICIIEILEKEVVK